MQNLIFLFFFVHIHKIYEKERYVYEFIKSYNFTKEGQSIIEKARELIVKSFKYRNEFNLLI